MRGQARKSLWIETRTSIEAIDNAKVRLVRACGSKPQLRTSGGNGNTGQARKSLWIETMSYMPAFSTAKGQARKSLWIETLCYYFV